MTYPNMLELRRHPGERRDLNVDFRRTVENPAFARMT